MIQAVRYERRANFLLAVITNGLNRTTHDYRIKQNATWMKYCMRGDDAASAVESGSVTLVLVITPTHWNLAMITMIPATCTSSHTSCLNNTYLYSS